MRKSDDNDVTLYATGTRNPFDIYVSPQQLVFATDNGPNGGFGGAIEGYDDENQLPKLMAGSTKEGRSEVRLPDEINLIKEGMWYGHPNVAKYREKPDLEYEVEWYS